MTTTKAIRNLVSKLANVHPSEIQLSDHPLSPGFVPQNNRGHSWWGEVASIQMNFSTYGPGDYKLVLQDTSAVTTNDTKIITVDCYPTTFYNSKLKDKIKILLEKGLITKKTWSSEIKTKNDE